MAIAKDPETDETIDYAWPGIEGKKITFTRKGTGMTNTSYVGYKFLDRKEEIPDEIVDGTCAINEYITIMTPEEIKKLMNAGEDEDDDDEKPRRGNKATKDTDDDDSERKARPNRLGRKAKDEDDTDDSEDEKPNRKAKDAGPEDEPEEEVKPRRRAKPVEEPTDDDEEKPRSRREKREAEAKAEKKQKAEKENPCTFGHKFGVDTDDYEDCEECPEKLYNKCAAKKDDDAD